MALVRLIYASRAKKSLTAAELLELTRHSAVRNAQLGISGALLFCEGFFLQMLEGEEPVVRKLYAKISLDKRHCDVYEISARPILGREFGDWGMSCLHESAMGQVDQKRLLKILARISSATCISELGDESHALLLDLSDAIYKQSEVSKVPRAA